MEPHERIMKWRERLVKVFHTSRGHDLLLYLLCLAVSFIFWIFQSLDTEVQRDYDFPFEIDQMPDTATFISPIPHTINVGLQGKGSQLLSYSWGHLPTLKVSFNDYVADQGRWYLPFAKLESRVRDLVGNGILITGIRPDSLRLAYTTLPPEKLPIRIDSEISANLEYVVSGALKANVDSVEVYSQTPLPSSIKSISTETIVRRNLTDTTYVDVKLRTIPGARAVPDRIRVCIPVEALIKKTQTVRIEALGVSNGHGLITFPSKVEVSYLVPISMFKNDEPLHLYVDFNEIIPGHSYLPLHLYNLPSYIRQPSLSVDSVEYLIDRQ